MPSRKHQQQQQRPGTYRSLERSRKYDIGKPKGHRPPSSHGNNSYATAIGPAQPKYGSYTPLSEWNTMIQQHLRSNPAPANQISHSLPTSHLWNTWLWGSNPAEQCDIDTLLNRNHAVGLLLARYMSAFIPDSKKLQENSLSELFSALHIERGYHIHKGMSDRIKMLCLFPKKVMYYTLKELRDTVQNLQVHWSKCDAVSMEQISSVIDACFCRFGTLASIPHGSDIMNDQGSIEDFGDTGANKDCLFKLNRICLRRFISVFLIFYRHIFLYRNHSSVPPGIISGMDSSPINKHHVLASSDDFTAISMNWDLIPAAKLNYMHDFPGW